MGETTYNQHANSFMNLQYFFMIEFAGRVESGLNAGVQRTSRTTILLVATIGLSVTSCGGSTAIPAAGEPPAPETDEQLLAPDQVCGLTLPCREPTVGHSHDLYGAMVAGLSPYGELLFEQDQTAGCARCLAPESLFAELLDEPDANKGALAHVYLSLKEVGHAAFEGRSESSPDTGWSYLHEWTGGVLHRARTTGDPPPCGLLSAHCASTPRFIAGYVGFLEQILFREPLDADPGYQKEHAVKVALAANPPGGLEVIVGFIKTRAEVRARMKAVRDICGYAEIYDEAREVLEWVVANDPDLAERARYCLERPTAP
jgi:hypothetical protein